MFFERLELRRLLSTYYVSTGGNDGNAGTSGSPWATLQWAADHVSAGDTVNIAAGNYTGFAKYDLQGASGSPIRFQATGAVYVTTAATDPNDSNLHVGIELSGTEESPGCSYIEIDGITVNNTSGTINGGNSAGFRVRFSDHITLTNCTAINNGQFGIYTAYVSDVVISGCSSITNNLFVDASSQRNHGIYVANGSSNVTIQNCEISGNNGNGIHSNGDGGINTGMLFANNTITLNGLNGGSAINCDGTADSIISGNLVFRNKNKGISLYAIDGAGPSSGNTITNNYIWQAAGANGPALQVKDDADNTTVVSNTLINETTSGLLVDFYSDSYEGTTFEDNVYYAQAYKPFSGDGSTQTFEEWRDVNYEGWDTTSIFSEVQDTGVERHADVNMDGKVTGDDYTILDANLGQTVPFTFNWIMGDVNRDGTITGDDYTVLDANLGT